MVTLGNQKRFFWITDFRALSLPKPVFPYRLWPNRATQRPRPKTQRVDSTGKNIISYNKIRALNDSTAKNPQGGPLLGPLPRNRLPGRSFRAKAGPRLFPIIPVPNFSLRVSDSLPFPLSVLFGLIWCSLVLFGPKNILWNSSS
jgi:hypothetical protein